MVEEIEFFRSLRNHIDLEQLAAFALEVRLECQTEASVGSPKETGHELTCNVQPEPMCGGYNIIYVLEFNDDVRWIARIPGHGLRFGELDCTKMDCEYHAMRFLRRKTTIPIPEVYFWTIQTNAIGVPFALMAYLEGKTLDETWLPVLNAEQRLSILTQIATYMSELYSLKFKLQGLIRFDDKSEPQQIGSFISLDGDSVCLWASTCEYGPYKTLKQKFEDCFDDEDEGLSSGEKAIVHILRMAVKSIPPVLAEDSSFAPTISDINAQNILIDIHGQITGFIDWDDVHTSSTCTGCGSFPSFITRDWDPDEYQYDSNHPLKGDSAYEESPEQLSKYRRHYAMAWEELGKSLEGFDVRMTRSSHLIGAITTALNSSSARQLVVEKLLDHAFHGRAAFDLHQYVDECVHGNAARKDLSIKQAFDDMWERASELGT